MFPTPIPSSRLQATIERKAVLYLRVSSRGQEHGDGFDRQRDACERFAASQGWEVVGEFTDVASGTRELEDRKGLARLLDRVENNGVRDVIVERPDRMSRDFVVGETILRQFREAKVRVWSADGGQDLTVEDDNPTSVLIRQVLGAVAEFDKTVTVHKLRAARERRRMHMGVCEGKKPYGEKPGEMQVIAEIQRMRKAGKGYKAIAKELTSLGVPTRQGRPSWSHMVVRDIIRREGIDERIFGQDKKQEQEGEQA